MQNGLENWTIILLLHQFEITHLVKHIFLLLEKVTNTLHFYIREEHFKFFFPRFSCVKVLQFRSLFMRKIALDAICTVKRLFKCGIRNLGTCFMLQNHPIFRFSQTFRLNFTSLSLQQEAPIARIQDQFGSLKSKSNEFWYSKNRVSLTLPGSWNV